MRYFFNGKIEKSAEDEFYYINIPFNVWEVCKQRDVIKADLLMDNKFIYVHLIPVEKGNYKIQLTEEHVTGMDIEKTHKILLHITNTLVQINQNSQYSSDNPIRKIDNVDIIIQPVDGTCGQTVVAMLTGVTVAEVCTTMGCREWQATMSRMVSALNYYGIDHSGVIVYTEGEPTTLPRCAILMEKMGRFCHYLLYFNGKYYDPNDGILEEYDMSKLLGFLEIRLEDED